MRRAERPAAMLRPPLRFALAHAGLAAATVFATFALLVPILHLWEADLGAQFTYWGDANMYASYLKTALEHGWMWENPSLGVPFGQKMYDYPFADNASQFVLGKILGLFSSDIAVVVNVFYLLTYPIVALAALYAMRRLGVSPLPALVASVLFTLLPYHFLRGEGHLFFSAYYGVPLGAYLALSTLEGRTFFGLGRTPGQRWRPTSVVEPLVLAIIVGSNSIYYAAFSLLLIGFATIAGALRARSARVLASGGLLLAVILTTIGVELAPSYAYRLREGPNPATQRPPEETEIYSLKFAQLVLPIGDHRIDRLGRISNRYQSAFPLPSEGSAALGAIGAIGFLFLVGVALAAAVGVDQRIRALRRYRAAAALTLLAFLAGTIGGLSTLLSLFVTPQLRSWNRISVVIAFLSLLAVALLLDAALRRAGPLLWRRAVVAVAVAALLPLGAFDQTNDRFLPDYAGVQPAYAQDRRFVRRIAAELPHGAMVYQLPYFPFPESGPLNKMTDYDHMKGYLHSTSLRWSYGAVKGRPEAEWHGELLSKPPGLFLPALVAVGFDGVYIDRFGYVDAADQLLAQLEATLGSGPLLSEDGRLAFFDLRSYADTLRGRHPASELSALRDAVLSPVRAVWTRGFYEAEEGVGEIWRWAAPRAELELVNPSASAREVSIEFTVARPQPAPLSIVLPDGVALAVTATPEGTVVRRALRLQPGRSVVSFATDAPRLAIEGETRDIRFQVLNPVIGEEIFSRFEAEAVR
jgi:hypothetical protein